MLLQAHDVDGLPVLGDVATDAAEGPGAVLQGVGADTDLRLRKRDDLPFEEGVIHRDIEIGHGVELSNIQNTVVP